MHNDADIVIIGSGVGGATIAYGLAETGAKITILEAGEHLIERQENRDPRAIFQKGFFRPKEYWYEYSTNGEKRAFNPGNYYCVGGNSKFYGAVLLRYRREDFEETQHLGGISPAWPYSYDELEPWYSKAEKLYAVRGKIGDDPTEPTHSNDYDFPPVPDEDSIAEIRARIKQQGYHPFSLPLGVDIDQWIKKGKTTWDAHPHVDDGKKDAETTALKAALMHDNISLVTKAMVTRLESDEKGKNIVAVHFEHQGIKKILKPKIVILAAGAVRSAALLLSSADEKNPNGLANRSDQVGRNYMNHNTSAVIGINPFWKNTAIYQKTFGFNDFYLNDGSRANPLGNVQLLGRITAPILKSNLKMVPEFLLPLITNHSIDFLAMSEDLPSPESRVVVEDGKICVNWVRTNWQSHLELVVKLKKILKKAGFPIVLSKPFDRRTPSHQCGTIRIGNDGATAPLNSFGQAFEHPNLYVCDASCLPTSAAVNPALTVAAQSLRVAYHIATNEL